MQKRFIYYYIGVISLNLVFHNSLPNLKNLFSQDIDLQGEWRVALTEISFPTQINNVTDAKIVYYKKVKGKTSLKVSKNKISRPYDRETGETEVNMMKLRNYATKSIGRWILKTSVIASWTPLSNIFHYGCFYGKE